jgi:hypothetical protein
MGTKLRHDGKTSGDLGISLGEGDMHAGEG